MDQVALAWIVASTLLVVILIQAWKLLGSFGKAIIATLIVGKVIAAIYYFVGLDRPVIVVSFENGTNFTITAAEAIFLSFLLTLAGAIAVVVYGRILPMEIRRALSPEGE